MSKLNAEPDTLSALYDLLNSYTLNQAIRQVKQAHEKPDAPDAPALVELVDEARTRPLIKFLADSIESLLTSIMKVQTQVLFKAAGDQIDEKMNALRLENEVWKKGFDDALARYMEPGSIVKPPKKPEKN